MNFEIKSRFTGAVLFECELTDDLSDLSYGARLGFAVEAAFKAGVNLEDADLAHADLEGVNLAHASDVYARRAAVYRARNPDVPVVESLDAKILAALESGGELDMRAWHTCETTHCRAGWAITLAGPKGKALEERYSPEEAGRRIYLASTGRVPYFFASNERSLEDIREQAALQAKVQS